MLQQLVVATSVGLTAGLSIGCIGVGGLIIVPVLVQLGGVSIHAAIADAMAGYIVTGLVGSSVFLRRGTLGWRSALPPLLGAMPGAVAGAVAASAAPAILLQIVIAGLAVGSGLQMLVRGRRIDAPRSTPLSATIGGLVGALTGFLSALTGTGGPAVLLPALLSFDVSVLTALGLAQAIQLPIALLATLGNAVATKVDWTASLPLGVGLAIGAWGGARLAHSLDQARLRRLVASVLLGVGLLLFARVARSLF